MTGAKNEISLDFEILKDIKDKRVSIGEIFALSLKYSTPETIVKNLNNLLFVDGKNDFYSRLKRISDSDLLSPKTKIPELADFLSNPSKFIKAFNVVFDLRHKYIHEFMSSETIELSAGLELLSRNIVFLKAVDRMVWEDLYPDIPRTQAAMNESSAKELLKIEGELIRIIESYDKNLGEESAKKFNTLKEDWDKIIDNTAKFFADEYALGGSTYPLVHSDNLSILKKGLSDYLEDNLFILDK